MLARGFALQDPGMVQRGGPWFGACAGSALLAIAACTASGDATRPAGPFRVSGSVLDAAAVPTETPRAMGRPVPSPSAVVPVEAAPTQAPAEAPAEPVPPPANPLELAGDLCASERHTEALQVLDHAIANDPSWALSVARAGVLRDLGRRHEALAVLRGVCAATDPAELHPGLWFERAELEWLEGHRQDAADALRTLEIAHASHPWVLANAGQLGGLRDEVATLQAPNRMRVRDLLGNLRGAPQAAVRMRTLDFLARPVAADATAQVRTDAARLRARAVAIAAGDESAAVRARAVQLADPEPEIREALCREALADPDPLVRSMGARRTVELAGTAAPALLVAALAKEADPPTFLRLHEALSQLVADAPPFGAGDEADAERRSRLVAAWRQRCGL